MNADVDRPPWRRVRYLSLRMTNFLSYRSGVLDFGGFTALVGPNGSGKSNAVAAIKLLRDIPIHGLPAAIAKRGGFDQLRHRGTGRPYDPTVRVEFSVDGRQRSFYELRLGSIAGKRYEVKEESGRVLDGDNEYRFRQFGGTLHISDRTNESRSESSIKAPPGQSILPLAPSFGASAIAQVLESAQTMEIR